LRHDEVDRDRQKRREQSGQRVMHATVALNLDDLVDQKSDQVHPREGGRERESRNDRVEGLRFEFLGDQGDSVDRLLHYIIVYF